MQNNNGSSKINNLDKSNEENTNNENADYKKKHPKGKFFLILFCSIIPILIIFYGTYYISINKSYKSYEKNIIKYINKIDNINKTTSTLPISNNIDSKNYLTKIAKASSSLNEINKNINALNPTSKYYKIHNNLKIALKNNIYLYNQIKTLFESNNIDETESYIQKIHEYQNICTKNYSTINVKNINMSSVYSVPKLINNIETSVYKNLEKLRDKEIKNKSIAEYINNIDKIETNFLSIKKDYSIKLEEARNKKITYEDLLNLINKDFSTLLNIKKDISNLIIPQEGLETYTDLNKSINFYISYVEKFKYALVSEKEKVKPKEASTDNLNDLYLDSHTKLADSELCYKNFINKYKILKKSIF